MYKNRHLVMDLEHSVGERILSLLDRVSQLECEAVQIKERNQSVVEVMMLQDKVQDTIN